MHLQVHGSGKAALQRNNLWELVIEFAKKPENESAKNDEVTRDELKNRIREKLNEGDVNSRDVYGRTALHWACLLGIDDIIALLLEANADTNCQDKWKNTPLHYATLSCSSDVILGLLRKGAKIWIRNDEGHLPLQEISSDTLLEYFDDCIPDRYDAHGNNLKVELDLTFLLPPEGKVSKEVEESRGMETTDVEKSKEGKSEKNSQMFAETTCLWWIAKSPQHQIVLKHPVITTFLYLKWKRISALFTLHCSLYILYLVMLYVFLHAGVFPSMQEARRAMVVVENEERLTLDVFNRGIPQECERSTSSTNDSITQRMFPNGKTYFQYLPETWQMARYTLLFLNSVILLLEFYQFLFSPFWYVLNVTNLLEVTMVTFVYAFLIEDDVDLGCRYGVLALFFSLSEVHRICSQLPIFSLYVHIFITISFTFIKLIVLFWSVLIIMYSSIFMLLFYPAEVFSSFQKSLLKTIAMLMGEFGYENIPFGEFDGFSHVAFLTFIVFMTIVLMNLLTGLAVGETQNIKESAKALRYASQVKLIFYMESIFLRDQENVFRLFNPWDCVIKAGDRVINASDRVKNWFRGSTSTQRSYFSCPSLFDVYLFRCLYTHFNCILDYLAKKTMLLQANGKRNPTLTLSPRRNFIERNPADPTLKALNLSHEEAEKLNLFMRAKRSRKAKRPTSLERIFIQLEEISRRLGDLREEESTKM
ncbi:unnamed protein product [Darwinula stevensoni]|uniref:Ion transport domain-containing protein n=1 Tax=Darwinula stevensoni TaxID=69355 RepID=A0A7R9A971_9CRUS|nr:unnamed protein product [Darwinula stevensoni]CAG0897122.1 unnamed protein product [Darwinula stevensoni]